jgi:hypothetical protein
MVTSAWTRDFSLENDRAQMEYGGDRYAVQLERLTIDKHFDLEVGSLRRADMRKNYAQLRLSPCPRRLKRVRKFSNIGQFADVEDSAGRLSTRISDGEFAVEFQGNARLRLASGSRKVFVQPIQTAARDVQLPAEIVRPQL